MIASRAETDMLLVLRPTATGPPARLWSVGRSAQLWRFLQHLGELVSPLAAADVHDNLGISSLGDLLLKHGLAGAETARDRCRAAMCDWEQRVYDALTGYQGMCCVQAAGHRARPAGGPALQHRDRPRVNCGRAAPFGWLLGAHLTPSGRLPAGLPGVLPAASDPIEASAVVIAMRSSPKASRCPTPAQTLMATAKPTSSQRQLLMRTPRR